MKKVLLTAALVLVATSAFAAIVGSKHDLTSGSFGSGGDQVCKYCHVPHNSVQPAALWARNTITQPVAFYTNPGSLNSAVPATITAVQSTACLSCHNVTKSTGINAAYDLTATAFGTGKTIGEATTGLSNDHPISIPYGTNLVTADQTTNGGQVALQTPLVNSVTSGTGITLPLFGNAVVATGNTVECATCHAVHGVTGVSSFLRTTNIGSKLCLKCHIK